MLIEACFLSSYEDAEATLELLSLAGVTDEAKRNIVKQHAFTLKSLLRISDVPEAEYLGENITFRDLFYAWERLEAGWPALLEYLQHEHSPAVLTMHLTGHGHVMRSHHLSRRTLKRRSASTPSLSVTMTSALRFITRS